MTLNNNSLLVKPLQSQLENINGKFRFYDGNLESETLSANWYGQPLTVNFTTKEQPKDFLVNVGLQGDWLPAKLPGVPDSLAKMLSGSANWQGKVAVKLPQHGKPDYQVDVSADLKKVSSHLPSPLDKNSGQALPLHVQVNGGLEAFTLSGSAGNNNAFNSQWLLQGEKVELARAIWQTDSKKFHRCLMIKRWYSNYRPLMVSVGWHYWPPSWRRPLRRLLHHFLRLLRHHPLNRRSKAVKPMSSYRSG